ncbi:peptidase inhibitor family I36 protein [Actinomadura mexicana]|uniref:Peptidase inhibitor family I36 n=1 Tax=Actinomadura mexicana TaxID=134959 RepID=A0A239ALB0_9ACTN|nr:peptidase inhibitor family I36 protein [Actinomadura mexicana]SNR95854.1 Peptidase inhibitor family I36 [Actinomadura mexicana]
MANWKARLLVATTALAACATVTGPAVTTAAQAATVTTQPAQADLPPGVVQLDDAEGCPPATLCLYQHYKRQGPAYGIGAGYKVALKALPMGNGTAANNVSSWVNNTHSLAVLIDEDNGKARPLYPGQPLEEPTSDNDTVDLVDWA